MKNLFDYATKELSQDAFLRWLFESYEDKDIKPCVHKLLSEFCGIGEDAEIKRITTHAQVQNLDIEILVDVGNEKHALYIEDKTFSEAHNQLNRYNEIIKSRTAEIKIKKENVKKIFYKTYWITKKDKEEAYAAGWTTYNIDDINALFNPYESSCNIILKQYAAHIRKIYNALHNIERPTTDSASEYLRWEGYFRHIANGIIEKHGYQNSGAWKAGQYSYVCLVLRKDDKHPYLEVRSRDFVKNTWKVYLLCYGLDKKSTGLSSEKIEERKNKIRNATEATSLFCRKNYKHELAICVASDEIRSTEDFICLLEKCAQYYDELIKLWNDQQ